ncbi:MAG: bifunctional methylenetetrahydrofolate dehydrogenase/methenyltetrahydrofolate cyclohydrolase FolD [Legionellales bacterium]|nr:bifunctional methylenetetrahydrofolate dehydrogenase/methenyltetrahydrofolate cyclohydrolase FolD [Legionellales bacterium]
MISQILNGNKIAFLEKERIKNIVDFLVVSGKRPPKIVVLLVGSNPASKLYVDKKHHACKEVGIDSEVVLIENLVDTDDLIKIIEKYNQDILTDAILVQLPLPRNIFEKAILEAISPEKDVDGFHPLNQGKLSQRTQGIRPCTPLGIMRLLEETKISLSSLKAVIVGASNIVGRPMAMQLLENNCTVTICHIKTRDLKSEIKMADLLISAVGKPFLIKGNWIKHNAIVVDAGIACIKNGGIVGDVDFVEAKKRASWITPVPGGVGPMTVAMLLKNTLLLYLKRNNYERYLCKKIML